MNSIKLLLILLTLSAIILSCSKDDPSPAANEKGTLTLHFDNVAGDKDLILTTGVYQNSSSETFNVTTLRYFISNIVLKTTSGTLYVVPKDSSYFLVDESVEESQDLLLSNIPAADYNEVSFVIGVDSLKSIADISQRKGVLDPTVSDMYWSWNSGYIFFKLEGNFTALNAEANNPFYYHIGGYGGYSAESKTINNLKTITISTGTGTAEVRSNIAPEIHLYVDVLKIFNSDPAVSIAEHPTVMFTDYSATLAKKYAGMIEFGHVHNDPKQK